MPRQEFSAGEVGMDNPISYNGVLLKDKLTTIMFTSSEHPHALPFGHSSIAIGFQWMGDDERDERSQAWVSGG